MEWPRLAKKEILIVCLLMAAFLLTRLINLTIIPIFTDEAIYLRWAQIAKNDAAWRFISLTDGKQPLFVWLTMAMMKVITDPLVAGRLVSVFTGLVSLVAIWFLTWVFFGNKKMAFFTSLFYLFFPFSLIYDRMALMDSLVGTFSLLSLFLAVLLVKTNQLDVALILGAVLGGAVLNKTSGFFNTYLLPLTLLVFPWRDKNRRQRLMKWFGLIALAIVISQGFYSILRLSPLFHMVAQKDTTFIYPLKEWLQHPVLFFWGNIKGQLDWLIDYLTLPWVGLILISFLSREKLREKSLLFLWFLVPFTALALFGKVLYPRFIFFMALPLLILAAWSLVWLGQRIKNRVWRLVWLCLIFVYAFYFDFLVLTNPPKAPVTKSDKGQYIISWPAGIGIKEAIVFFKQEASRQSIMVATEGTFGMFPAAFELYLWDHPKIEIKGYWPVNEVPEELLAKAQEKPVYLVFNETQEINPDWPLELVKEYPKIEKPYSMKIFRVLAD